MSDILPLSGLQGHEIRNIVTSDNTGSHWFLDEDINIWSKRKPVRWNSFVAISDNQMSLANYGLSIPFWYNSSWDEINKTWVYLRPRGGVDEPYRISDFKGYNHNAVKPFTLSMPDKMHKSGEFYIQMFKAEYSPAAIALDDLSEIKDKYLACALVNKSRRMTSITTASVPLSGNPDDAFVVWCDISSNDMFQSGDEVDVYAFLTSEKLLGAQTVNDIWGLKLDENTTVYKKYTIEEYKRMEYFANANVISQSKNSVTFDNVEVGIYLPESGEYVGGSLSGAGGRVISTDGQIQREFTVPFLSVNANNRRNSFILSGTFSITANTSDEVDVYIQLFDVASKKVLAMHYVAFLNETPL